MMAAYIVKVLEANYIIHDVKRFVIEKPEGYDFLPGQATDISINLPEWKNECRPFTFTSLREWNYLEFMIRIYNKHQGLTNMLGGINAGDELIIHDVFGTIEYKGPGVFIAGGAGITPFISIFRDLYRNKKIQGNKLIYSNKTSDDIILDEELQLMLKQNYLKLFTRENVIGYIDRRIDRNFLIENIADFNQHFYVCGPDSFVSNILTLLKELGADAESLIFEK